MKPIDELPKRVQSVIHRCAAGETLVKTFRYKETGDVETLFAFHPSGRKAGPKSSGDAIASGYLVPNGDGLFGESQTWRAA